MSKLEKLAKSEGMDVEAMLEAAVFDSVIPGICMNKGCNYTTDVEPDQNQGWCEPCGQQSVCSALVLAQII